MRRALVAALVVTFALSARAEGDQRAAAQVLFEQGRALVERGRFAEACPKLAESKRLDPGIGTMLWLADCFENNGQTASAWAEFKEAAAAAALQRDGREKIARSRADALRPKLSYLTIVVPRDAVIPQLDVWRDDVAVGPAEWGVAVPMDPGTHAVSAKAPGRRPWSASVAVAARAGTTTVNVPPLDAQETPAAAPPTPAPQIPAPPPPAPEPPPPQSPQKTVGIVAAGAGGVAVAVGAFLGLRAMSKYDDSNKDGHCLPDNECDATGKADRSDAKGLAAGSTIAFVAGGVLLAGGAILYLSAPRAADKRAVLIAPAMGGFVMCARF